MGEAVDALSVYRAKLFAIAYRMLGSAADAEDVLQDAWLRMRSVDDIANAEAWLTTTVSRLCIDRLRSARTQREVYVGPWLPEPVITAPDEPDPQSISLAFLVVLERLSPLERAVLLLHDVFDYEYVEIAQMLESSEAAVRQLRHRAHTHVSDAQLRFAPSKEAHERLLLGFVGACQAGDVATIAAMLAADARAVTDGGGKVRAARNVVLGRDHVARFIAGLVRKGGTDGVVVTIVQVNGWPALLMSVDGMPSGVVSIETDGALVLAVNLVLNPDKLGALRPSAQTAP